MQNLTEGDALKARILAAAAATPAPTRTDAKRRGVVLLVASIAFALLVFEWAGGIHHSDGRPATLTLAIAAGWGLFCAAISWFVLWRGRSTLGRPPFLVFGVALATPLVLIAWMHWFNTMYAEPFQRLGLRCLGYNLLMATAPLVSLIVLRRGAEPRMPWALGAGIGAVCGAWAGVLVDLWCPLTNLPHVLVGHVLPLMMLVAVGTALGMRVLGLQRPREAVTSKPSAP
jgi:hypothetical protein